MTLIKCKIDNEKFIKNQIQQIYNITLNNRKIKQNNLNLINYQNKENKKFIIKHFPKYTLIKI